MKKIRGGDGAPTTKPYSFTDHADWVDKKNNGCSHFGVHPSLLRRDDLRFDTFHMKCAITRKLMTYLRNFMLDQADSITAEFCKNVLKKFWNDYHLYIWTNNKYFSTFQGNELALFVANVDKIIDFLKSKFVFTSKIDDIAKVLSLWVDIFRFLGITYITDNEKYYNEDMKKFDRNVQEFYSVGGRTFLTKDGAVGSEETFYCHTLRYYFPPIAHITFERHGLGVGIFTMQGFERRNKESKNCMKRFGNNKGNIVESNMKRVFDIFKHDMNSY